MNREVSRRAGADRSVSPLELFFDLVYVLAVGQLSHHLLAHPGVESGVETLILALAVIYAWYMTAWAANWLDPGSMVVRSLLIGLMFASLLMSSSIGGAFDDRGWLFVTGYLLLQLGRTIFLMVALRNRPLGRHFSNACVWEVVAGALWVSGLLVEDRSRATVWAAAVLITYIGVFSLHWLPGRGRALDLRHTEIAPGHLLERIRLFFIIALGETVLSAGTAFVAVPITIDRLIALSVTFVGIGALWWCYFQRAESVGVDVAENALDAGEATWGSTWALTLMVLALIGVAVAGDLTIAHPDEPVGVAFLALAFGSPALFLAAQTLFLFVVADDLSRPRLIAILALAVCTIPASELSFLLAYSIPVVILVAVAVSDTVQWTAHEAL